MSEKIKDKILAIIEDMKGVDPKCFFVRDLVGYTDWTIVVTGTSSRHVKAIADKAETKMKEEGTPAFGIEGLGDLEWVLIDFGDAVIHVMTAEAREFYQLEKLFS